ncbi:MAG: prepilin peptidase [Thermodesulfobacteriota bacterium]|nr:prepilin peptidase [Thermodesulfobacteriota bacterium]
MIWVSAVVIGGLIIGSFLNVCIYRIPQDESIIVPGSHCPKCGAKIAPWDNIPILSYLFLRGRCRNCKVKISPRYPLVEAITALLALGLLYRFGPTLDFAIYFILVCALVVVTFIDIDHQIIPDRISISGILIGLVAIYWLPVSYKDALIGLVLGGGILMGVIYGYYFITGKQGMGGGDVKLLAMIGVFIGWKGVLFTILTSSAIGSVVGLTWIALTHKDTRSPIPFGPFLSLGAIIYLFWGGAVIDWYMKFMNIQ